MMLHIKYYIVAFLLLAVERNILKVLLKVPMEDQLLLNKSKSPLPRTTPVKFGIIWFTSFTEDKKKSLHMDPK